MAENEDDDPVGARGPAGSARNEFTALAVAADLVRPGDPLDQKLVDFGCSVALDCAAIADQYSDLLTVGTAGDEIRSHLGLAGQAAGASTQVRYVGLEPRDPVKRFTELATTTGMLRPGDKLDQNEVDFATNIVDRCASLVESFGDGECGGNAAEHIRAELFD